MSDAATYLDARLSPDDGRLRFDRLDPSLGSWDLWIADPQRNVDTRITSDPRTEVTPVWLKNGRGIVFVADRGGSPHLYKKDLASGVEEELRPAGRQQQAKIGPLRSDMGAGEIC